MLKKLAQKNRQNQSGFTILIAVVTAGILLIIAMSIGGIALKEQVLSSANKDSQIAFYAADTGMECALYWDQVKGAFVLGDDAAGQASLAVRNGVTCNGQNINVESDGSSGPVYAFKFMVTKIGVGETGTDKTCAVVSVSKDTTKSITKTVIKSYGYNTCDPSLRRIERGIIATYP